MRNLHRAQQREWNIEQSLAHDYKFWRTKNNDRNLAALIYMYITSVLCPYLFYLPIRKSLFDPEFAELTTVQCTVLRLVFHAISLPRAYHGVASAPQTRVKALRFIHRSGCYPNRALCLMVRHSMSGMHVQYEAPSFPTRESLKCSSSIGYTA